MYVLKIVAVKERTVQHFSPEPEHDKFMAIQFNELINDKILNRYLTR